MANRVIESSTGRCVVLLQAGMLPRPGCFEGLIAAFAAHPEAGALASPLVPDADAVARLLGCYARELSCTDNIFATFGLTSLDAAVLRGDLSELGLEVSSTAAILLRSSSAITSA